MITTGSWRGFEDRDLTLGDGPSMRIRIGGSPGSPAVLMLHSILTSSAIWERQASLLAAQGLRVICLDMRGHGGSESAPPPYTMDDLVDDAVAVLDALAIPQAHIVGVSQGGMIALGAAARHPQRVASLFVTAARADAPFAFANAWNDRIALVERDGDVDALSDATVARWFGPEFVQIRPALAHSLSETIKLTDADGFIGCARAIQGLDYLEKLPSIKVPLTFVIGANDTLLLEPMRDLASMLCTELIEIAGAGHLPMLDRPDQFDQHLMHHFAQTTMA